MKIRVLIVDDEPLARQRVRLLLGEEPDVEVIGESEDGFEAVDQIQELQPMFKGENLVVLKNGKSYPTTRPIRDIQQRLEFR